MSLPFVFSFERINKLYFIFTLFIVISDLPLFSVLSRGAKIRRVMMAARRTAGALGERAGVIVDRTRPLVPLSAIPEDLIAQAQVDNNNSVVIFLFWKYLMEIRLSF